MALGNYNQQTGEFNEAIKNFQIVNKLNPDNTAADKSISLIHKYVKQDDPHLLSMEAKLTRNLNEESSQRLYFALGKAHEDLKNHKNRPKFQKTQKPQKPQRPQRPQRQQRHQKPQNPYGSHVTN